MLRGKTGTMLLLFEFEFRWSSCGWTKSHCTPRHSPINNHTKAWDLQVTAELPFLLAYGLHPAGIR